MTGFLKRILRSGKGGVWVILLLVGVGLGFLLRGGCEPETREVAERPDSGDAAPAEADVELWICSMNVTYHPYYSSDRPGKCKFCGMDLIPAPSDGGDGGEGSLRRLVTSEAGKALMDVETSPVERRFVTAEIRMAGKVEYDETRVGYITAWVPGRLDRLFVDYTGVTISQGDHMVYIYSPEVLSAQTELLEALKAVGELADSDIDIIRESTLATVEAARGKLRLWGLKDSQIEEIEKRGTPADHITIYAPMGGTVVHKHAQEGMYVQTGTRIYTIADLSRLWVKLDAYESDLMWLRYGQAVTITTEAYPGEEFHGKVAFIEPVLDERTRTVKVRVNVPNPDGKLKPAMFVRAVVRPRVAAGGRVMEPELVGKWICPMHPEIAKTGAGECDICGMPLVTAESLGYVPVEEHETARPLVIPVTAALVTGKRAVVYVEVPEADRPTFEGREVVLGPRAGDYYIVRRGLQEGDLVVTSGSFKIDSALQIRAKPSMMTPQGGGGGGAHQHGGGSAPGETGEGPAAQVAAPASVLRRLHRVDEAYAAVSAAVRAEDLARIKAAFGALGEALEAVEAAGLSGHAAMVWKESSMLLGNDAFEGSEATKLREGRRAFALLKDHMQPLRDQFGLGHDQMEMPEVGAPETPAAFRTQVDRLWEAYQPLQAALAGDDFDKAALAVDELRKALDAVDMGLLGHEAHMEWMVKLGELQKALDQMRAAREISDIRASFGSLSEALAGAIQTFGMAPAGPIYKLRCPMAFDNRGANWLQADQDVRNPYFGAAMLSCGEVTGTVVAPVVDQHEGHMHD